jgi:hypothetical protein
MMNTDLYLIRRRSPASGWEQRVAARVVEGAPRSAGFVERMLGHATQPVAQVQHDKDGR